LDYLYSPKLSDICPAHSALVRRLSQAFKLVPEEPLLLNGLCALGAAHLRDQCSRSLAKVPKELPPEDYRRQIEQYQQEIDRNQQHFERHKRLAISWLVRKLKQGPEAYLVSDVFGIGLLLLGLDKYLDRDAVGELRGVTWCFMSMLSYLAENSVGKSDYDLLSAFGPMVVDLKVTSYVGTADRFPASFSNFMLMFLPLFLQRIRYQAEFYISFSTDILAAAPATTLITTKLISITTQWSFLDAQSRMEKTLMAVSVYLFILLMCVSPSHCFYRTLGKGSVESCGRAHDFLGGQESRQFGTAVVRYWTEYVMDG
jgi:hypothetical protein